MLTPGLVDDLRERLSRLDDDELAALHGWFWALREAAEQATPDLHERAPGQVGVLAALQVMCIAEHWRRSGQDGLLRAWFAEFDDVLGDCHEEAFADVVGGLPKLWPTATLAHHQVVATLRQLVAERQRESRRVARWLRGQMLGVDLRGPS